MSPSRPAGGHEKALERTRDQLMDRVDVHATTFADGSVYVEGPLHEIVSAYLDALREELPEQAVEAAVDGDEEARESVELVIRAFLAALKEQE